MSDSKYICEKCNKNFKKETNYNTKQKTNNGYIRTIIHNGYEIKEYMGMCLLRLILGDNTEIIIDFLRNKIN